MEKLKEHKIFTMEAARRNSLLTAAMNCFARNGYKKTTTDEIMLEAEISKGLLFHYFGTKKDLYIFLFRYANSTIMQEFYTKVDLKERDLLKRLRSMFLLKFKLTNQYPAIFDFVSSAYFEKDPVVSGKIKEYTSQLFFDAQKDMLKDIDLSLFKENLDAQTAINIIIFTLRGYSDAQTSPDKRIGDYNREQHRYLKEIDQYIAVLRSAFYMEGI